MRLSCNFGVLWPESVRWMVSLTPKKAAVLAWMKSNGSKIANPRCLNRRFSLILERTSPHAHGSSMMLIQSKIRDDLQGTGERSWRFSTFEHAEYSQIASARL